MPVSARGFLLSYGRRGVSRGVFTTASLRVSASGSLLGACQARAPRARGVHATARWALAASLLLTCLLLPSCARLRHRSPAAAAPPVASPVVRGASSGLELWWWVVSDQRVYRPFGPPAPSKPGEPPNPPPYTIRESGISLESALVPYLSRPVPLPDDLKARWKASGLRVISVPVKDLETIQASLRLTGPVQQQWLGEMSVWTDIVRGPEFSDSRIAMHGDKPEELTPGRIRMMARAWTYPDSGGQGSPMAALRLEVVPQFEPQPSDHARLSIAAIGHQPDDEKTRNFDDLSAGVSITTRRGEPDAIVIVPDRPDADWTRHRDPLADDSDSGPSPELPPTLGETMLAVPATKDSPRSRAVIILIPRLPQRFELLGR